MEFLIALVFVVTALIAVFLLLIGKKIDGILKENKKLSDEIILLKGGDEEMALCYAYLIIKGLRTFESVPKFMKEPTKKYLIALEAGHLVPGETEEETEEPTV